MPEVSVIMPVYNGEKYIRESMDSVINQTHKDFEFIIINDCSSDNTENIIKSYNDNRIKYVKNKKNLGVALSLNKGLNLATGKYIARMDADDISLPYRFEEQIKYLKENKECDICSGDIIEFDDNGNEQLHVYSHDNSNIMVDLLFDSPIVHPAVMMRSSIKEKIDLYYDIQYEKAEDFELWARISDKVRIDNLNKVLLKYRIHNLQVSVSCNRQQVKACRKIRYRSLVKILGKNKTEEYIDIFDDFCNNKIKTQEEYETLCECFRVIYENNKRKKIYSDKILGTQLSLIKLNLAMKNRFKLKINTHIDCIMFAKIKLSKLYNRIKRI